jgi:hypothetical protein
LDLCRELLDRFYNNPIIHLSNNPFWNLVEPEVVATSPYRIKSPVPVCCGFDSIKIADVPKAGLPGRSPGKPDEAWLAEP